MSRWIRNDNGSKVYEYEYTGKHDVPKGVERVRFHPSVTKVERYSFHARIRLKEVVLNEGLTVIEEGSFQNCNKLQRIMLPSTLTEIGKSAFTVCPSLRGVVLNEGLKKIGAQAFRCAPLERVTIPSTVIEVDDFAFGQCKNLREVVFNDGIKKIGYAAFVECLLLERIEIPSTVIHSGNRVFDKCRNLKQVVLREGTETIDDYAFTQCAALESITLPSTVRYIGRGAFKGCTNLREVKLSEGLATIGAFMGLEAFEGCPLLEKIDFPSISPRLRNIISAGHTGIGNKIDDEDNHGIFERIGAEIFLLPEAVARYGGYKWIVVFLCLDGIYEVIEYYEMKEATTLFELALWKTRIDEAVDDVEPANRDACRIEVPGPVKDTLLQYLDYRRRRGGWC